MPEEPAKKPIVVTAEQLFTLPGALLISVILMAGAAGIGWANLKAQTNRIEPLEVRVGEVEKDMKKIDVMANDIGWIKREMENQRLRAQGYRVGP
jgi:hypothetical protein